MSLSSLSLTMGLSGRASGAARITLTPGSATAGTPYSGTIAGNTGTVTATSTDGTVLTVVGSTVTGTFVAAATSITISLTDSLGTVNIPFTVAASSAVRTDSTLIKVDTTLYTADRT